MSDTIYKAVTKVNVTVQVEVQPFSGGQTMDEIRKVASREAREEVLSMIEKVGNRPMSVCGEPDVLSILIKESKS